MLKQEDFKSIDHKFVASFDGVLIVIESSGGVFRLYVYGSLGEVPKSTPTTKDPSEKEWVRFLTIANKVQEAHRLGERLE